MPTPAQPKIYHILHVDRLRSIASDGRLWCDGTMAQRDRAAGTVIGSSDIKQRRLEELTLASHPDLHVGECVPFYFCPRSVMLYVIFKGNHPELVYRDGQTPIVHLEADLHQTVAWAGAQERRRWAFTSSNAGSYHFDDYSNLTKLDELDWDAIEASSWAGRQDGKQAEFLIEYAFPWELIARIGVYSQGIRDQVFQAIQIRKDHPPVEIKRDWYY